MSEEETMGERGQKSYLSEKSKPTLSPKQVMKGGKGGLHAARDKTGRRKRRRQTVARTGLQI